jgi:hypothetical protein
MCATPTPSKAGKHHASHMPRAGSLQAARNADQSRPDARQQAEAMQGLGSGHQLQQRPSITPPAIA